MRLQAWIEAFLTLVRFAEGKRLHICLQEPAAMQLTAETFSRLQSRLDDLASQAVGPLREQVFASTALRGPFTPM